jgi:hypothetical protein
MEMMQQMLAEWILSVAELEAQSGVQ